MYIDSRVLSKNEGKVNRNLFWFSCLGAIIIAIYVMPFFLTWETIGRSDLPPLFENDQYFYLQIVNLETAATGLTNNPWYHIGLLLGAAPIKWSDAFSYMMIGYLGNAVFPLRRGDVGRMLLTSRKYGVSILFLHQRP